MVLESCPFCHRPFEAEQVSREPVDSSTEDLLKEPPRYTTVGYRGGAPPLVDPTPVTFFTTYKIVYRCKHCGKEWSRFRAEEREVDRKVAGPEQASYADVEIEAERDKEERESEQDY